MSDTDKTAAQLIAEAVHKVDCGCDAPTEHTDDSLTYYAEVAEAVREALRPEGKHRYLSTACQHERHDECRLTCKFCRAGCVCTECDHGGVPVSGYTEAIRRGDELEVRNAFGNWVPAVATSGVEGVWKNGKKIHDFPVMWVDVAGADGPIPWPVEDVRRPA